MVWCWRQELQLVTDLVLPSLSDAPVHNQTSWAELLVCASEKQRTRTQHPHANGNDSAWIPLLFVETKLSLSKATEKLSDCSHFQCLSSCVTEWIILYYQQNQGIRQTHAMWYSGIKVFCVPPKVHGKRLGAVGWFSSEALQENFPLWNIFQKSFCWQCPASFERLRDFTLKSNLYALPVLFCTEYRG